MNNKEIGRLGEDLAESYLQNKGYQTVARNFRTRYGEIDLVMRDREYLVFVEVKTRRSIAFGEPHEAIDQRKQRQLQKMAQEYLSRMPLERDIRFDAVSVYFNLKGRSKILHWENIIPG